MKKLLLLLLALVAAAVAFKSVREEVPLLGGQGLRMVNPYPPSSPLHAPQQVYVDRFNAHEKLRKRFAATLSSKGLYAELGRALSRGSQSVADPLLVGAMEAMAAVIPRLDEANCAKLVRPADDFDPVLGEAFRRAMEALPPRHHRRFWDFYLAALEAEVDDQPPLPVDQEALRIANLQLADRYHGVFAERLVRVIRDPHGAPDEDACWAANTVTFTASQLEPASAAALARQTWGRAR